MHVKLTNGELDHAIGVGVKRTTFAILANLKHKYGYFGLGFDISIAGAIGERAVAKVLDMDWDPKIGKWTSGDVGGFEVRTTLWPNGQLCVHGHPADDRDAVYLLIRIPDLPNVDVAGWMYGRDAQNDDFWTDKNGNDRFAYFVPNGKLNHIDTLPRKERNGEKTETTKTA